MKSFLLHSALLVCSVCVLGIVVPLTELDAAVEIDPLPVEPMTVVLVPEAAEKRVHVPFEDIGQDWRTESLEVDSLWLTCTGEPGGIGFDEEDQYAKYITLDIGEYMAFRQTTCYVRTEFQVQANDLQEFDYMALQVRFDDGFIAYINGERVVQQNAPANVHWRAGASQTHDGRSTSTFDISEHLDKLVSGTNILAIHAMNVSGGSADFLIAPKLYARKNYYNNFEANLPIVSLHPKDQAAVPQSGILADFGIIHQGDELNKLSHAFDEFSGTVHVRKLVNEFEYPKEQYSFNLLTPTGEPNNVSFLGLPEGDEWLLYAPYSDKTLLRTALMCEIAHALERHGPVRLVHVFIAGEYEGIYVLMESRNVHRNRIDISNISPLDISGDALTGGYIFQLGRQRWRPGFASPNVPYRGGEPPILYQYLYPDGETIVPQQQTYIQDTMVQLENALLSEGKESLSAETRQLFNIHSFVDYFILNEIAKNVNAYRMQSVFFKDRDSRDGRIHLEPSWDFEHALGNVNYYNGWDVRELALDVLLNSDDLQSDTLRVPAWWAQLAENNDFKKGVYKRWFELNTTVFSEAWILDKLDSLYTTLKEDRVLNFERWQVMGKEIWPNEYVGISYDDDYDHLYLWILDRLDWLNLAMEEFETAVQHQTRPVVSHVQLAQNYPNPFNPMTRISYALPSQEFVSLVIYDVQGRAVERLVHSRQNAGVHHVEWDASSFTSGVYFYTLTAGKFQNTRRMLLLR